MIYPLKMLGLMLGVSSLGLLALLLISALKGRFFTKYPLFYVFVTGWLMVGLLRFVFYTFHSADYEDYSIVYWYTQFLLVAGGYSIGWQIYAHTLNPYPGTVKMARILVSTVFIVVLIELFFTISVGRADELTRSIIRLERNLHGVQAILIVLFVMLVWYYGIPLGKNLRGLVLGYGFFVGTRLITLALRSFLGRSVYSWWYYSEPVCVLATLIIWSFALRSYYPNPIPGREIELEHDYELAAQRTVQALSRARGYLARAFSQ